MKELGLFGLTIPEEYGGLGLTMEEEALVIMALGQTSPAFRSLFGTTMGIGSQGIVIDGTERAEAALPAAARHAARSIASFALTEPEAGSDAASLRTTALRDGDHYVLNGTKRFITNAPQAGIFTVMARTDPARKGRARHLRVHRRARHAGHQLGKPDKKMGQNGAHTCDVIFEDCPRAGGELIGGSEGAGFKTAMKVLDKGRIHIAAVCVGVGRAACSRDALRYAMRAQAVRPADRASSSWSRRCSPTARPRSTPRARWCWTPRAGATTASDVSTEAACAKLFASEMVRPRRRPRRADPRRRRLHRRLRHRALLPRRAPVPHLRRHERRSSSWSSPAT